MDENNKNTPQNTGLNIPARQNTKLSQSLSQQAAVNYRRQKIENIYNGGSNYNTPHTTPIAKTPVSQRVIQPVKVQAEDYTKGQILNDPVHNKQKIVKLAPNTPAQSGKHMGAVEYHPQAVARNSRPKQVQTVDDQGEQWKRYHQAWQNYYQKYYEGYYSAALEQQKKAVANVQPEVLEDLTEGQKKQRALAKLQQNIAEKARQQGEKIRKSRHFVPIVSAIVVVLLFMFLQYNRLIFASVEAYVSPGNANASETIYSPNASNDVSADPKLIIPKINVDAPVVYGVANDNASLLKAMENGVVHFSVPGANSVPGQVGNTVISGHSSNDIFDGGQYKFIFSQIDKLNEGDVIYVNYQGKRYTYSVKSKKVVLPNQVNEVVLDTDKPMLTLITCTPLGTAEKRLLVFAEQVSPDPSTAQPADKSAADESKKEAELPRNSLTFFERLFTWNWN